MAQRRSTTKGKQPPTTGGEADECFTIMPFGGWFDEYYTDVFCPAIKAAGLIPRRADDLYRPSAIVHDIWSYTRSCKLVLADLTGKNPNVFYELGLAHAIAKPAILVTESIGDVPFDLRALRVIEYDKNAPAWGQLLREKIESSIREVVAAPLQSVLPSFLDVEKPGRAPITEHQKEILEIKQELELLRREFRRVADGRYLAPLTKGALREQIRDYLSAGILPNAIFDRLVMQGVPAPMADRELMRYVAEEEFGAFGKFQPGPQSLLDGGGGPARAAAAAAY